MTSPQLASTPNRRKSAPACDLEHPRAAIERIVREARYDYDAATETLIDALRADESLREYVVAEGARYLVRNVAGSMRGGSTDASEVDVAPVASGRAFHRHHAAIRTFLDDHTLPGGIPIGDARAEDLKRAIEYYGSQEAGMRKQRKFLEAVGKKLPAGKRVREVFSDAQLKRMLGDAR